MLPSSRSASQYGGLRALSRAIHKSVHRRCDLQRSYSKGLMTNKLIAEYLSVKIQVEDLSKPGLVEALFGWTLLGHASGPTGCRVLSQKVSDYVSPSAL